MQAVGGTTLSGHTQIDPGQRGSWRSRLLLAGLATVVVSLDLVTKQLTVTYLAGAAPVELFGGVLYLTYATNSGAAFGLGSSYTWVFPLIAFAVIGWIGWLAVRLRSWPWAIALGLMVGGAVGNLVDRLIREPGPFRGEVVDMISVFAPDGSVWPVFNVADSSLVVGVLLVVFLELTGRRRDGTRVPARQPAAEGEPAQEAGPAPAADRAARTSEQER